MIKGLLVENGVVVNTAEFESAAELFGGYVEGVGAIGYADNGDGTFSPPAPVPLSKDERIANLKGAAYVAERAPIEWEGSVFDVNGKNDSYNKLLGAERRFDALAAVVPGGDGTFIRWTLADNTTREMSKADISAVLEAIDVRAAAIHYQYALDKQAILDE